jgi:DNA-binding NarL/FixJ family response regulator
MRISLVDRESNEPPGPRVLLEKRPALEVVGEAAKAEDLSAEIETACPDLVLLS